MMSECCEEVEQRLGYEDTEVVWLYPLSAVFPYGVRHILIDPMQSLAHADVATAAMARHMT